MHRHRSNNEVKGVQKRCIRQGSALMFQHFSIYQYQGDISKAKLVLLACELQKIVFVSLHCNATVQTSLLRDFQLKGLVDR